MARISQEFCCRKSGGGCGIFFVARLNAALDMEVDIQCPKCGHLHRRYIHDGKINIDMRGKYEKKETIRPTAASCSETPITDAMKKAQDRGNGVELSGETLDDFRQRWLSVTQFQRGEVL